MDEWQIEKGEILAVGGQATIYFGYSISREINIVLKKINKEEIIEKELRMSEVRHPNIIQCFGQWIEPDHVILEYLSKGDLENMIEKEYHMLKETPITHIEDILKGIDFLHQKDIVHLDLHPKNILIDVDQNGKFVMKICDFGLSKKCTNECFPESVKGRPGYVSPENVKREQINPDSDIWAFGCILWKLLTKEEAYKCEHALTAYYNIGLKKHPEVPSKWPVIIQKIFFQCWDSRNNASDILSLFKNARIKRKCGNMLINEMPLRFYECNKIVSDPKRIVPAIEWENIDKLEVLHKYCVDHNEFENIKRQFNHIICKRKFKKITKMIDLLKYLNENGHVPNVIRLNETCIGKLCEMKKKLLKGLSKLELIKFARSLGMLDDDIENLNNNYTSTYFVNEIFEFWSDCSDCIIPFNVHNFHLIVKNIGSNIRCI